MEKFVSLHGFAAPLRQANVDTDKIIAAKYLKTISRQGLGKGLFSAMRYDDDGVERPGFILNRAPWRNASILVALDNFGCGSSREHAPWSLADFGIRAIIAPSFADIFHNNCFKNGILPITLERSLVEELMSEASDPATARFAIDLPAQTIRRANGDSIRFSIDPDKKNALLHGIDEIGRSEAFIGAILKFEAVAAYCAPPIPLEIAPMGQRATNPFRSTGTLPG